MQNGTSLDEEFAGKMQALIEEQDDDERHRRAIGLLSDLLQQLGCEKTVSAFDLITNWYS